MQKKPQLSFNFERPKVDRRKFVKPVGRPKAPRVTVSCSACGAEFERYASAVAKRKGKRVFCTVCYQTARKQGLNPRRLHRITELDRYHNGRRVRLQHDGYPIIYEPSVARISTAYPKGWDLEHRIIAERLLGRRLRKNECVHHINGVRTDNRPKNLAVLTRTAHRKLHSDEVTEKLQRLAAYERRYGPLDTDRALTPQPAATDPLHDLKTKGVH